MKMPLPIPIPRSPHTTKRTKRINGTFHPCIRNITSKPTARVKTNRGVSSCRILLLVSQVLHCSLILTFPPFHAHTHTYTGPILSGRPEARYEAYARAYAGCGGPYVNRSYRRSYARRYEALRCRSHGTDDQFALWARDRPHDLIGQSLRLEALETDRHVVDVFHVTSGRPALENTAYDPHEVWGFWEEGPFASPTELAQSFVFQRRHSNEAAFAIVHAVTEQVWGVILLRHDDPANLSVQLEPPILPPSRYGTVEQLEACFLLMDRLFAHGYRRIQMAIDAQDAEQRQLSRRLGMTLEGCLCKHRIVKEANRDSHIYSMTNSDWNAKEGGARAALFGKLYGAKALRADQANALKEEERDEQEWGLAEQKRVAEQEEQQPQQPESKKKV